MRTIRRSGPLVLALAILLAAAACSTFTNLDKFGGQKLTWGPCAAFTIAESDKERFADPALDCAYLQVPLDYSHTDGQAGQIAVLRRKATGPGTRIGSLLVNPGGPGASGIEFAAMLVTRLGDGPIAQRFDLVGFDPRGVGASKPRIQCYTGAEHDAVRLDVVVGTSPAAVARLEDRAKDFARKCSERSGGDAVLANMGTRDAAKDMDILRAALGDTKLTYLGYSYGTGLGTAYAEEYPQNVRALVLDGAVDPNQNAIDASINRASAIQHAFDAFAAWCAIQGDCPLGPDPAKATEAYHQLTWPIIDHPVTLRDGRKLSYTDTVLGTYAALYNPVAWGFLKRALGELVHGRGEPLMVLADIMQGRQSDGGYNGLMDIAYAIACLDSDPIKDPAQALELDKRVRAAAPVLDDGRGPNPARDNCAFWPVPGTRPPHVPRISGLPQVMVISTTGDPATPFQQGVNLAKDLGARLLTVEGTQHGAALEGNACVDDIVTRYLVDLVLPPEGARCAAQPK
ncbi:MAG TPA: alpha/beta hydrolase [Pseudonocardiaceae bacterium]|nr:alpha/beta hydrolase [Pseudonocardiaceae bacterium]